MSTVGERLREAIDKWGGGKRGVRSLVDELKTRGVKGSTRQMVQRYLNGAVTPPLDFLEAAAKVLGVRVAWLAFADGPATDAEAEVARSTAKRAFASAEDYEYSHILGGVAILFPRVREATWWDQVALVRAATAHNQRWAALAAKEGRTGATFTPGEIGEMIGAALVNVLDAIMMRPGELTRPGLALFLSGMSNVLLGLAESARLGDLAEALRDEGDTVRSLARVMLTREDEVRRTRAEVPLHPLVLEAVRQHAEGRSHTDVRREAVLTDIPDLREPEDWDDGHAST